ncbi:hypothetical protein P7C70_g3486, partial [Phenoliferia sp. Uapishka_3]
MALNPSFATHRIGRATAAHTLELYLDLICPFSEKQLMGVRKYLVPLIESNETVGQNLQIILRFRTRCAAKLLSRGTLRAHLSTKPCLACPRSLPSRARLRATVMLPPSRPLRHSSSCFKDGVLADTITLQAFYDEPCAKESPNATRERLADLAAEVGVDRAKYIEATKVGKSNGGTPVTPDLKLAIKYGRQNGVHVTPTVALDGLIDGSISSSFTDADWKKYLLEKVLPPGSKL